MNDIRPSSRPKAVSKNWVMQLYEKWLSPIKSREQFQKLISLAGAKQLIGAESQIMLEGVMKISQMHVAEIMIPTPKMDLLDVDMPIEEMLEKIIDIGHSRYPVYENEKEKIKTAHWMLGKWEAKTPDGTLSENWEKLKMQFY